MEEQLIGDRADVVEGRGETTVVVQRLNVIGEVRPERGVVDVAPGAIGGEGVD